MNYNYYLIMALICLLGLIVTIYVIYFGIEKRNRIKKQILENSVDLEAFYPKNHENKTKKIVSITLFTVFFVCSILLFISNIVMSVNSNLFYSNGQYIVSIESSSMQENLVTNSYLFTNNLTNEKLFLHDVVSFKEVDSKDDLKLYDIVLYKTTINNNETYIAHRIIDIKDDYYVLRGDSNLNNDEPVYFEQIEGVYDKTYGFLSFINAISKSVNFYLAFSFVVIDIASYEIIKYLNIKLINDNLIESQ